MGNTQYLDHEILAAVVEKRVIDTKNIAYDFDIDRSYTWEIDQLMSSGVKQVSQISILLPLETQENYI